VSIPARMWYTPPPAGRRSPRCLVAGAGTPDEQRFIFYDALEIGRFDAGRIETTGLLLVEDPTVSSRHCVVTQHENGTCTIRDLSRNGTRLDGRRLVPNLETEFAPGQSIEISAGGVLQLCGDGANPGLGPALAGGTFAVQGFTIATVLVGDIRDYTVMVRQAPSLALQQSVGRVFERLTEDVVRYGGTVKEYQGDAIFAFWEGTADGRQAVNACRAALALNAIGAQLAADPRVWDVPTHPLGLDWALATGPVVIDSIGGATQRAGLSMIGEAVVLAFRLEKFATPETGPIVACDTTRRMAASSFEFRSLGEKHAKGFDRPDQVFALLGPRAASDQTVPRIVR
jgi:adenylate cyclase